MINIYDLQDSLQNNLNAIQQTRWINLHLKAETTEAVQKLLSFCPNIAELNIHFGENIKLPDFGKCTHLERLSLRNLQSAPLLSEINLPVNLKRLKIEVPGYNWYHQSEVKQDVVNNFTLPANTSIEELNLNIFSLVELNFAAPQPHLKKLEIQVRNGLETINRTLENCVQLKKLKITASCKKMECDFSKLPELRELSFNNFKLTNYNFLDQVSPKLNHLYINSWGVEWSGFPKIWRWKNLYSLRLQGCTDTYFPKIPKEVTRLSQLYITNNKFENVIEAIQCCRSIKDLYFNNPNPIDLNALFGIIPQITRLFLCTPTFSNIQLSDEVKSEVISIQLAGGGMIEHLNFLDNLPAIKYFSLEDCQLPSPKVLLRTKTVPLHSLKRNLSDFKFKNEKQFCALCSAIARSSIAQTDKEFYAEYFSKKRSIEISDKWDWNRLYDLAAVYHPTLKKKVLSAIDRKVATQYGDQLWTGQEVVYIAGNPKKDQAEIKRRLVDFGISIEKELTGAVTHVLLCVGSVEVEKLSRRKFIPLTLTQLRERAAQEKEQFLVKNAAEAGGEIIVEKLGQLLTSNDLATVKVGLEMIEQGGLPAAAFPDLLILQKTTVDNKIRKVVTQTLETFAPREWLDVVRDGLSFKAVHSKKSEDEIRRQFRKLARRTSAQLMQQLSRWLYEKTGRGLSYALKTNAKAAVKQQAYDLIFQDGYLDFAKGLGQVKEYAEDIAQYYQKHSSPPKLPVAALKDRTIIGLNLWRLNYQQLDENIAQFKDLERLNLAHNYLEELPVVFAQLTKLEVLDLSHNEFKTFPMVLQQLPNLRKIDMRKSDNSYQPQRITVPIEFSNSHPNCEIIL